MNSYIHMSVGGSCCQVKQYLIAVVISIPFAYLFCSGFSPYFTIGFFFLPLVNLYGDLTNSYIQIDNLINRTTSSYSQHPPNFCLRHVFKCTPEWESWGPSLLLWYHPNSKGIPTLIYFPPLSCCLQLHVSEVSIP